MREKIVTGALIAMSVAAAAGAILADKAPPPKPLPTPEVVDPPHNAPLPPLSPEANQ